jgi:hypothetical protein
VVFFWQLLTEGGSCGGGQWSLLRGVGQVIVRELQKKILQ